MTASFVAFVLAGAVLCSCSVALAQNMPVPVPVVLGGPGAREPQVAVSPSGAVFVAFGARDTVYCARSGDGAQTFERPVTVAAAGHLSLGMRRGPRIVVTKDAIVITAVYGRDGNGGDGDLLAWQSRDEGESWRGPFRVNDVPSAAREGLHAMVAGPNGQIVCAWLDLRGAGTQLYASTSRDNGVTWQPNRLVYRSPDKTICECCHPSLAFDANGTLWVMWRNAVSGNRDMYVCRSQDNGRTFTPAQKLGTGTWPLDACPMDGGGLAIAPNHNPVTLWRRDNELFRCGEAQSAETRVGRGQQPWLASGRGGVYAVWLAGGRPGQVQVQLPGEKPRTLATVGDDPVIATAANRYGPVVAAWSAADGVHVVPLALPPVTGRTASAR